MAIGCVTKDSKADLCERAITSVRSRVGYSKTRCTPAREGSGACGQPRALAPTPRLRPCTCTRTCTSPSACARVLTLRLQLGTDKTPRLFQAAYNPRASGGVEPSLSFLSEKGTPGTNSRDSTSRPAASAPERDGRCVKRDQETPQPLGLKSHPSVIPFY